MPAIDRDLRLAFMQLDEADLERLCGLRPLLEAHADDLVDAFYRHLLSFAPTRGLLTEPAVRDRLLGAQRHYLISLASPIDDERLAELRRIGATHVRVGLEPAWYLGAYSLYLTLLAPLIYESWEADRGEAEATLRAVWKRLLLDAQIAMEEYIAVRERQLDFLNQELAQTGRGLARQIDEQSAELRATTARARAAEQLASVGTLAAGLAHEIGTPMSVIRGHAELLEKAVDGDADKRRLATIRDQIDRISNIMEALLNLARPRAPLRGRVELQSVLDTALSFLEEKLRRRGIEVDLEIDEVPALDADADKLQQLFLNLILNAADAMPEGGKLTARIGREGERVFASLRDTGTGIGADRLGRIFEPFFTSKEAGRGSGLGLVVAKQIAVDHGGDIEVESVLGRGTEFRVLLPLLALAAG